MFVVYNLAHKNQCIRSLYGGKIRVLGCFTNQEKAYDFVKEWTSHHPDLETRVSPVKQFRVLSKEFLDLEQQETIIETQLKEQTTLRDKKIQDVLNRAQNKEAPDLSKMQTVLEIEKNSEQQEIQETSLTIENISPPSNSPPSVTTGLALANQNFAALAILPDDFSDKPFEDQEPCFAFFGTADTEDNLQSLISKEKTSQQHGPNESLPWTYFPIVGIQMQEFVTLAKQQEMSSNRRQHDANLQNFWEAHQTNGSP